jgi:hypothetical protein
MRLAQNTTFSLLAAGEPRGNPLEILPTLPNLLYEMEDDMLIPI